MEEPSGARLHVAKRLVGTVVIAGIGILLVALVLRDRPDGVQLNNVARGTADVSGTEPAVRPLRAAMTAAFVAEDAVGVYDKIVQYVGKELGRPCELVRGLSYSTVNMMLEAGAVDFGFVCGLPYVQAHDHPTPGVELIAAPVMQGERYGGRPKYFSEVIVGQGSPVQSFADLRGCTFAYNDEFSNSGYNLPRYRMIQLGYTDGFFKALVRTGSHEESIAAVLSGKAEASAVDSLVLDCVRMCDPDYASGVRVIESIGPAGIPPVVASAKVPQDLQRRLRDIFTRMHEDAVGRGILDGAQISHFAAVEDSNYDDIRAMARRAEETGFTTIR